MLDPGPGLTEERIHFLGELTGLGAWIACIADGRGTEDYKQLLHGAGLCVTHVEHHHNALDRMIRHIGARLELLRITFRERLEALGVDFARVRPVLGAAQASVHDGILDYVLIVAEKPA